MRCMPRDPGAMMRAYALSLSFAVTGATCASVAAPNRTPDDPPVVAAGAIMAFTNVHVVSMTTAAVRGGQTVVVRDGRVADIGDTPNVRIPTDAVVIDGAGRYLMPSLIDMHVHLRRPDLSAYLRAGIGGVRNMWGHPGITTLMRGVADGTIVGPSIHSVSPGVDGTPPQWPYTRQVLDPADADTTVAALVAEGWMAIKVYQRLSLEVYLAVADAARRRGLPLEGHVPTAVPVRRAIEAGQRSIEHLTGYDVELSARHRTGTWGWIDADVSRFEELARITADGGTWNCPTLAIYVKLAEQNATGERAAIIENRRRFVRELARAHAPLLVGTDAGIDVVVPGVSLHDELAEFVASGLTPYEALRGATVDAGRFLGVPLLGTVTVGAPADLLLLSHNPLTDIGSVKRFTGLVLRGAWYSREALQALP